MADRKYAKYFFDNFGTLRDDKGLYLFRLDDTVAKGAPYLDCAWFWPPATPVEVIGSHTHHFEEVIAFFGNKAEDPKDLGGEIEFWLGDEQYIFSASKVVFVPKDVKHGPLIIRKSERPIFHFSFSPALTYSLHEEK